MAARLCVYSFGPGTSFEGGVVAALERMQLLGSTRVLDVLFVAQDPATGEVAALTPPTRGDSTLVELVDFRLDQSRRQQLTQRTLDAPDGVPRATIEAIGATIEPEGAIIAMLLTGSPPDVLREAVDRMGGRVLHDEAATAQTLGELERELLAATGSAP